MILKNNHKDLGKVHAISIQQFKWTTYANQEGADLVFVQVTGRFQQGKMMQAG